MCLSSSFKWARWASTFFRRDCSLFPWQLISTMLGYRPRHLDKLPDFSFSFSLT